MLLSKVFDLFLLQNLIIDFLVSVRREQTSLHLKTEEFPTQLLRNNVKASANSLSAFCLLCREFFVFAINNKSHENVNELDRLMSWWKSSQRFFT